MDVWEYFARRDAELAAQSVAWDEKPNPYSAEAGSDGQRGTVYGRISLGERAFLSVHEMIRVIDGVATRYKYAYYLIYDGAQLWGEERDPKHALAVHRHDRHHNRSPCSLISFNDALAKAWRTVCAAG